MTNRRFTNPKKGQEKYLIKDQTKMTTVSGVGF